MSPEAVADALEEVRSRLSPEMLQFLKQRGATKAAEAAAKAAAEAAAAGLGSGTVPGTGSGPASDTASLSFAPSHLLRDRPGVQSSSKSLQTGKSENLQQPGVGSQSAAGLPPLPAAGDGEEEEGEEQLLADPRLEARLRFGLHAKVVGIQPEGEKTTKEQVRRRETMGQ